MRKKMFVVTGLLLLAVVLSGCKLPASTAPELPEDALMTTPIIIVTDAVAGQPDVTSPVPEEPDEPQVPVEPTEDFFADPTATPEPTIMVPTVTRPAEYTLREGEFPFCIARRFNLDVASLLSLNNIGSNDLLPPGSTLQIPQTGTWDGENRSLNPHPTTHTVRAGETIYSIACFYGPVSPEAIIAVNQLEEPYQLTAGQSLSIP